MRAVSQVRRQLFAPCLQVVYGAINLMQLDLAGCLCGNDVETLADSLAQFD